MGDNLFVMTEMLVKQKLQIQTLKNDLECLEEDVYKYQMEISSLLEKIQKLEERNENWNDYHIIVFEPTDYGIKYPFHIPQNPNPVEEISKEFARFIDSNTSGLSFDEKQGLFYLPGIGIVQIKCLSMVKPYPKPKSDTITLPNGKRYKRRMIESDLKRFNNINCKAKYGIVKQTLQKYLKD